MLELLQCSWVLCWKTWRKMLGDLGDSGAQWCIEDAWGEPFKSSLLILSNTARVWRPRARMRVTPCLFVSDWIWKNMYTRHLGYVSLLVRKAFSFPSGSVWNALAVFLHWSLLTLHLLSGCVRQNRVRVQSVFFFPTTYHLEAFELHDITSLSPVK